MNQTRKKFRYAPVEVAKIIGLSTAKFLEFVNEGKLPKGRIGEDGKRYYTETDLEFIRREWKSKTTGKFVMVTLPAIAAGIFIIIITFHKISTKISERIIEQATTPTPRIGYAAPPLEIWAPGTPWPTRPPKPTPTPKPYVVPESSGLESEGENNGIN